MNRPGSTLTHSLAPLTALWLAVAHLVAAGAPARAAEPTTAAASATTIEGALPNGVRYTLLPHRRDLGRVSVRLVVLAGSLDERDNERGYAHFVEHMAFNGTRHYPPGKLLQFFQSLGVAFGADLTADTSITHTTYKLDLPAGRGARLGQALEVLRDFADGINFGPAEVQREKGVILSERSARNTDDWQVNAQRLRALYAGTQIPERFPIGDPGVIERATAESLRSFYRRCYHPARMRLTIVGDIDPATAKKLIEQHCAPLRADASAIAQVLPTTPLSTGFQAHAISSASAIAAGATLAVVGARGDATPAGLEADLVDRLVVHALDRRLRDRRALEPNRIGGAGASTSDGIDHRFLHYAAWANAAEGDWESAVRLLENEVRRAREDGFTAAELSEISTSVAANLSTARDRFASTLPDRVASQIAATHSSGREWHHPNALAAIGEAILPRFNPTVAHRAVRALWSEDRLRLILVQRTPAPGARDALLAAYHASAAGPLAAAVPAATARLEFRYGDFGRPAAVSERRAEKDLGVELIRFANGARLNLRPSATEPNHFRLTARFGRGVPDLPRDQPGLPHLAAHLIGECNLGRHTREEVTRLLDLRAVSANSTYLDHQLAIEIEGPTRELPFALQMLTAWISDAKLERSRLQSAMSDYGACRANHLDDAAGVAEILSVVKMASDDARLREPPPEEFGAYFFTDISAWARTHWLEGPLEIGIAGDFDLEAAVKAAAASIGTLATRRALPAKASDRLELYQQSSNHTHRMPLADQAAAVRLTWAAPNFADSRRQRALTFACEVLEDRLQKTLRHEFGATYSPTAGIIVSPRQRDFGYASVALTFAPERAEEFAERAATIAHELARDGVTAEEFNRLREPLIANTTESLRSNEWWLAVLLAHAQSEPALLEDVRAHATGFSELTRDEVSRIAAECFRPATANAFIVIPTTPAPPPVEGEPATSADFVQRAGARTNRGDIDGALADFARALELNPKNDDAYVNRSAVKMVRGDIDGSMADCTQAIALNPKNALAYANRGGAKLYLGAADGAIADCTKAIELDPTLAIAHGNRAGARLARGDLDGCIADATKAIELDPKNAVAHVNRGAARGNKGELDGAIADSSKAIEIDPRNADAYNNRAYMRQLKGELDAALTDFDRAIELNPRSVNSYRNRGVIHQTKGRNDAALADYDKTIDLSPDDVVARVNRGMLRQKKDDPEGAIADLDHSIRLDPKNADAFNNRGYVKQLKGDLDGAIADYTTAIELRPDFAMAFSNRGAAKKAKGDRMGAIDDTDQSLRLNAPVPPAATKATAVPAAPTTRPKSATTALIRGANTKRSQRDLTGALVDLDKAIADDPDFPDTYVVRASIRLQQNATAEALADVERAIALRPDHAGAFLERGIIRRTQREYPKAIADFTRALQLSPKLYMAQYHRGLTHEATRNWRAALTDFDSALAQNPNLTPAYNGRGLARQNLGDYPRAIADFSEALKRSANYTPALFNRGVSQRVTGDLAAALANLDQLIGLNPTYANAHANRACVRAALADHAGAVSDYATILARAGGTNAYTRLFQFINQRRLDPAAPAADFARAVTAWSEGWEKTVGQFLLGEIPEERFLAEAKATAGRTPQIRASESNYFAAMKRLIDGDSAGARPLLEQSVNARQPLRFTHTLAIGELARLGSVTPPP